MFIIHYNYGSTDQEQLQLKGLHTPGFIVGTLLSSEMNSRMPRQLNEKYDKRKREQGPISS